MEACGADGDDGGGGGGGKDAAHKRDPPEGEPDLKRRKHEEYGPNTVRGIMKTLLPFQKQLEELKAQLNDNNKDQIYMQELNVLHERDARVVEVHNNFWPRVLNLSPILRLNLLGADKQMFEAIKKVKVTVTETTISVYMAMEENSYFENKHLIKTYHVAEKKCMGTTMKWKDGMDPKTWLTRRSFFDWFSETTAYEEDELAQSVVQFYMNPLEDVQSDEEDWVGDIGLSTGQMK